MKCNLILIFIFSLILINLVSVNALYQQLSATNDLAVTHWCRPNWVTPCPAGQSVTLTKSIFGDSWRGRCGDFTVRLEKLYWEGGATRGHLLTYETCDIVSQITKLGILPVGFYDEGNGHGVTVTSLNSGGNDDCDMYIEDLRMLCTGQTTWLGDNTYSKNEEVPCSDRGTICSGNYVSLSQDRNLGDINIGQEKSFFITLTGLAEIPTGASPADIMFILDRSGSMGLLASDGVREKLAVAVDSLKRIFTYLQTADALQDGDSFKFGLTTYNHDYMINYYLNRMTWANWGDFSGNIYTPCGCTGIADTIMHTIEENFENSQISCQDGTVKKVIILASDGQENREHYLDDIKGQIPPDITFYTIGINANSVWQDKLRDVSTWGTEKGIYYDIPSVENLYDIYQKIGDIYSGTNPASAIKVTIHLTDNFEYVSSAIQPSYISTDKKTIEWTINGINLGQVISLGINVKALSGSGNVQVIDTSSSKVQVYNKCGIQTIPLLSLIANIVVPSTPECTSGAQRNCANQNGVCQGSKETCSLAGTWPGCTASNYGTDYQTTETSCTDNKDNDCDGLIDCQDSDCSSNLVCIAAGCAPGQQASCVTGEPGVCSEGTKTCNSDRLWGLCTRNINPSIEICNDGKDNDCDGFTDCDINEADCLSAPNCNINCATIGCGWVADGALCPNQCGVCMKPSGTEKCKQVNVCGDYETPASCAANIARVATGPSECTNYCEWQQILGVCAEINDCPTGEGNTKCTCTKTFTKGPYQNSPDMQLISWTALPQWTGNLPSLSQQQTILKKIGCISGSKLVRIPSIKLNFFNIRNFVIAIIVIVIAYLIINKLTKKKDRKIIKRKKKI